MEGDAPRHRRDADRVAVIGDPFHDPLEQVAWMLHLERAEVEAVRERDRERPHRHDVADDPADTGRGPVVRVDVGGMVVALDPHGDRQVVSHADDRRIVTRPDDDLVARGVERLEQRS